MIRDFVVIENDVVYGANLDTGYFVVLRKGCIVGDNVCIWSHCTIDPLVRIGHNVKIHNHCYIAQGTIIEDDVFLGPGVIITNDKYPPRYDSSLWEPPIIKRGAAIGGNVTIGPGVIIGEEAKIGAGTVVINDVPTKQVWVGNPARRIR